MFIKTLISAALVAMSHTAQAIQPNVDTYFHEKTSVLGPAMWTFSADGVKVHSADGTKLLKDHTHSDLACGSEPNCFWFDAASDGHKYVWATALHAGSQMSVFSLDTGDFVGNVDTCGTPLDVDYVPNREEMWVRCAGGGGGVVDSHMAVVSTNALSASAEEVFLGTARGYGRSTFHNSLGNFGYATHYNHNVIFKIDMASRRAVANFTMEGAHASYDMTYSAVNKHLFIRTRVCCSCQFPGADAQTCGRGGTPVPTLIEVGPFAGQTVNGTCGGGCEGSKADVIGVLEFDTVGEKFLGGHQIKEGTGFGATPEASPDGKHIVLFGNDGAQNLRVLRAGANGVKSTVAFDIPLQFENVPAGSEALRDFAFVKWNNHDIIALSTGYDNNLAIIDLDATPPKLHNLKLSDAAETTGGRSGRMIEWAYGTNYLWVDAASAKEIYVIRLSEDGDVTKAVVERTIPEVSSSLMVYAEDFAERKQDSMIKQLVEANIDSGDDDDDASPIAIAALAIGVFSLILNFIFVGHFMSKSQPAAAEAKEEAAAEDNRTLGSKRVA